MQDYTAINLHYQSIGSGEPIMILHGLFGSLDNWSGIAKKLAETRRVITVDLRNHGRSPHTSEQNYDLMALDVITLLNHLELPKVDLIGHSMGGKVAMAVSEQAPELLRKLIVVDIAPRQYESGNGKIIQDLLDVDLTQYQSRREVDAALLEAIPEKSMRLFLLMNLKLENGKLRWRINLPALAENRPGIAERGIGESFIKIPTCFIRGSESDFISGEDEIAILKQFTESDIVTIPNAGHWVHAAAPDAFLQVVTEFLDKKPSP